MGEYGNTFDLEAQIGLKRTGFSCRNLWANTFSCWSEGMVCRRFILQENHPGIGKVSTILGHVFQQAQAVEPIIFSMERSVNMSRSAVIKPEL